MQVQPYLFFDGRCEEAVEFYRRALGAEVTMLMRFKDSPEPHEPGMVPPGAGDELGDADELPHRRDHGVGFRRSMRRVDRASRAFRCRSRCLTIPRPSGCSLLWPTVGRCRCRWPRPSFPRASASSMTALACHG